MVETRRRRGGAKLVAARTLYVLCMIGGITFVAIGRPSVTTAIMTCQCAIAALGMVVLGGSYGGTGMAAAWCLSYGLQLMATMWLLPRIVGAPLAKELIFTGRRMKADEARAVGLVNHLVPAGQARAKAREIAETIARNGPIAVRQAKKAIAYGSETDLETAMILAIEAYNATVVTEDRLEGVRAFNEKRKPQFKGR